MTAFGQHSPRSTARRICSMSLVLGILGVASCQDLPVVARGRHVEIATERDDVICGGTVARMDDFLASAFAEIGEPVPSNVFVRYEWLEAILDENGRVVYQSGRATATRKRVTITADQLNSEHELAHAVHFRAWPRSRSVLHEGFAVLLDSDTSRLQDRWPAGEPLDPLLEDGSLDTAEYFKAWFLVSQVVRDHGFEGLRDFWHRVAPDASAAEVRAAYQALFGRPIDALIEPYEAWEGGPLVDRWSCYFALCGEPTPWNGDTWQAEGPFACEDDPDALGPTRASGTGPVERYHVVELEPSTSYRFTAAGGLGAFVRPCGLQCLPLGSDANAYWAEMPRVHPSALGGRHRVEILADLADLPTATPATFTIERLD
jgi:hypothetical protein